MQTIITFLDELIVITLLLSVLALALMMIAIFYAFISESIKEEILPMIKKRTPMDLGTHIFFKYPINNMHPIDDAKYHLPCEHSLFGLLRNRIIQVWRRLLQTFRNFHRSI